MGVMIDGVWHTDWYESDAEGAFRRPPTRFRHQVTADGSSGFPAARDRYHLYVSLACPWAHRTLIARRLKGLEDVISVSVVHYLMGDDGWVFGDCPGCTPDTVNGARMLREIYLKADPHYTGRVTVPVLWDKVAGTIVNNESSDIMRMFNSAFDAFATTALDLYPAPLRDAIDAINAVVYDTVNNGVYKAGFATRQGAYERAARALFATLDDLEERLARAPYLCGAEMTEADWRLFTTLVRFDAVYHGHFKCNLRRLVDYPNLWAYTRALYQWPKVAETVDFTHIKRHYYESHRNLNPYGIVPIGPELDFEAPHDRGRWANTH